MPFPVLPSSFSLPCSLSDLSRRTGLSRATTHAALRGEGRIASQGAVRRVLGLRWSWTAAEAPALAGRDLAALRQRKRISQRAMARRLSVSPQTILTMETAFRGRCATLAAYLRVLGVHELLDAPGGRRRLVPGPNDHDADLVFTPPILAAAIIADLGDHLSGDVLDPARGEGAFFDAFPAHARAHWCELSEGRDFFAWTQPVDWIVTNPPFSRFRDFLIHAMALAPNVVFLAPLTHFTTKHRVEAIRAAGFGLRRILLVPTPADWPSSGFQLATVWLQRGWDGPSRIAVLDR